MSGVRGDAEEGLLHSGQQVDRYVIKDIVGRGGLAVVYRVEHTQLKSSFALKQLLVTSPDIRQRLRQEGIVQANVRHANLVLVTDMIELPTGPGLVMEFVNGPTLEQLLAGGQQLPAQDVDRIAEGLLSGVVAAHEKGLIHRDLKPANVLLQTGSGMHVPRITDFGFVKMMRGDADLDLSVTRPGIQLGTPRYMAPEQATDARKVDQRADVYSLGAVLYELATGQKAFPTTDAGVVALEEAKRGDRYIPPRELRPEMPPRWQSAIEGALRADPTARVASAADLLALWQGQDPASSTGSAEPLAAPERPVSPASSRPSGLRRGLIGMGIVAAGLAGTLLAWRAGTVELPDVTPAESTTVRARPVMEPIPRAPVPQAQPAPTVRPTVPAREKPPPAAVVAAPPGPDRTAEADSSAPPVPRPVPQADPESEPVVEALPQTRDLPADHGTVQVEGDTTGMYLQRGSFRLPPGGVPSGSYKIIQVVSGAQPVTMGSVEVIAGEVTTVRCSKRLKRCK